MPEIGDDARLRFERRQELVIEVRRRAETLRRDETIGELARREVRRAEVDRSAGSQPGKGAARPTRTPGRGLLQAVRLLCGAALLAQHADDLDRPVDVGLAGKPHRPALPALPYEGE